MACIVIPVEQEGGLWAPVPSRFTEPGKWLTSLWCGLVAHRTAAGLLFKGTVVFGNLLAATWSAGSKGDGE